MKLNKEELKRKIDEKIEDENVKIELLEDIEDSFDYEIENTNEYEELKKQYEELRRKYKERFFEKIEDKDKEYEELEEKKVIDVKEI